MHRTHQLCLAIAISLLVAGPAAPARGQSFTTIATPLQVPLHWQHVDLDPSKPRKLGIYASLDGGTPQLFEFDTGGAGFYAAYASGTASPWWGGGGVVAGGTFSQVYDSGLTYTGTSVAATVRLYASGSAAAAVLEATDVVVGQTPVIVQNGDTLWPLASGTSLPPTNGGFWGDFGMAPKQGQAGIDSLAGQLRYGAGVTPGFRVHAASESPWVQFGLGAADLAALPTTFPLNVASGSSAAGVPYYQQLVVTGSLFVQKDNQPFAATTGFIFDTGASMTIHNAATFSPFPAHLTKDHAGAEVVHGATFIAGATSVSGSVQAFLDFTTGGQTDVDKVAVKYQADDPAYYFNTGITPFTQNDFIYNLASQQVVMVPLPEPGVSLAAAAVAGLAWLVVRPGAVRPRTTSIPPSR